MRGDWNPLAFTDSYKMGHFRQYPPGTEQVYSYFESRGSDPKFGFTSVVFFGLQYLLGQIAGEFVTAERIDKAERRCRLHFGNDRNFNRGGWEHLLKAHDGRLPVRIRAVPEGTVVPTHNCLMIDREHRPGRVLADELAGNHASAGLVSHDRRHPKPGDEKNPAPIFGSTPAIPRASNSNCTTSAVAAFPASSRPASAGPPTW